METGDDGPAWQVKLHFPPEMDPNMVSNQTQQFAVKRERLRPDVPAKWSPKYNNVGDPGGGVYAEIHT
eukprot:12899266-Prorocentrum_lima.AAC.1